MMHRRQDHLNLYCHSRPDTDTIRAFSMAEDLCHLPKSLAYKISLKTDDVSKKTYELDRLEGVSRWVNFALKYKVPDYGIAKSNNGVILL